MGLWGTLGAIGAGIAAPFTGGTSLAFLPGLLGGAGAVGDVLSSGGAAAAQGRRGDSDMRARMAMINNRALVDAAGENRTGRNDLIRQVMLNRLRADVQPWQSSDPRAMKFRGTGGMGQTLSSPVMRALAERFSGEADQSLKSGDYKVNPQMATLEDPGMMENIGGIAGTVGSIGGALAPFIKTKPKPPTDDYLDPQYPWGQ